MQEANKKLLQFSVKFYLHFCFGPYVCIGKSSLIIFGVVPGRGSVRNIMLLHTHTHTHTHHTSSTPLKTFLFPALSVHKDESRISIRNFLTPVKERINRPGPLWRIFSSSFEEHELLDAWPLDVRRSGCRCDTPGPSSKPPSYSQLLWLGAPAS